MTNEEAINYFKRSYASGDTDDERQHNEALDMAIKALEDKGYNQGYERGFTDGVKECASTWLGEGGCRMTNEEAKTILTEYLDMDSEVKSEYLEAMRVAIKAIDKISHLIDRPCEACEFHKENGCSKWNCVFEEAEE